MKIAIAFLALTSLLGCNAAPAPTPANDTGAQTEQTRSLPDSQPDTDARHTRSRNNHSANAAPGDYDFYLLNLSWSPEFCFSHRDSPECAAHPGFVVHGLWPQNNDGTYPEHCPSRPGPDSDADWQGLLPTAELAQHEWQTHGTCTPYSADDYFSLIRRAFTGPTQPHMQPPTAIIDLFAQSNPSFPAGSIALSCGNNYLTAVGVCFDKNLHPTACQAVRTCRANQVKITPR